ncbi:acyl-CoA thioesterase II [Fonsecaea erecta]|uniref:Acyl-CoA thioesterase II n=1 Tax=Fonsecaea erecta TaxID=1367422 RepID=A0A178Z2I5_9EURO|nr:acyl-CoA thioesterase II [Fonsecaea erecta]OAP53721.1 acyl-CoA thioesterase II [Fonsecaea erecta]
MSEVATCLEMQSTVPRRANIDEITEVIPALEGASDIFTNAYPNWQARAARGIFGGTLVAQALSAAHATVPPDFIIHSMHCHFILAAVAHSPMFYHVERIRDGKSFITRTVQVRQRGKCVFTATLSFTRERRGSSQNVEHVSLMPTEATIPMPGVTTYPAFPERESQPFESTLFTVTPASSPPEKRMRLWLRAINPNRDCGPSQQPAKRSSSDAVQQLQAQLSALAFMTDGYFIDAIVRVHGLAPSEDYTKVKDGVSLANENRVQMMVSLSHTIYFHNPHAVCADEWMLIDVDSPWAGDERGLAVQRIWSKSGVLLATCFQEGLIRLNQDSGPRL